MEGNLRPSADQIAERSGVSRRTLFRYFDDMDDLARTAAARQVTRVAHLLELPAPAGGPLARRATQLARQRHTLFSALAPALRVMRLRAPFSSASADMLDRSWAQLREQIKQQFRRDVSRLPQVQRQRALAAVDAVCSFETYEQLCLAQRLNDAEYVATLRQAIAALLTPFAHS